MSNTNFNNEKNSQSNTPPPLSSQNNNDKQYELEIHELKSQITKLEFSNQELKSLLEQHKKNPSLKPDPSLEEIIKDKETMIKQEYKIKALTSLVKDDVEKIDLLTSEYNRVKKKFEDYKKNAIDKLKMLKDQNSLLKKKTREQEEMVKTIDELQEIIESQRTEKNVLPSNNLNQYNEIRNLKNEKIKLVGVVEGLEDEKNNLTDIIHELELELHNLKEEFEEKLKRENELRLTINVLKKDKAQFENKENELNLKLKLSDLDK
jgi:exonuclease SbcC